MFFTFFDRISMPGVKLIICLVLAAITAVVWFLPDKYIYRGIEKPKLWHNLKLWVSALMLVQAVIYILL